MLISYNYNLSDGNKCTDVQSYEIKYELSDLIANINKVIS